MLLNGFYGSVDGGLVGHIKPDRIGIGANLQGRLFSPLKIDVGNCHRCALFYIGFSKGLADTARSTRNYS